MLKYMENVEQEPRAVKIARILSQLLVRLKCSLKLKCCESECINNPVDSVESTEKTSQDKYIQTDDF